MSPIKSKTVFPLLILLLATGVSLWRLGQAPLYDTEAFYAETGLEMRQSGDWLTPRFDYDRFLDKPPLYYWMLQPSYGLLGETEQAARLPAALSLAGCVGLTILLGGALFDATTGWLAGLLLATTMGFSIYSHNVLVEPVLTLWITASLFFFWRYHKDPNRTAALAAMYLCWALGFLTKGLTALVFPAAVVTAFLFLRGGFKNLKPLFFWPCWLLFLALSMPWHLWIASKNKGYLWFYFVHEQFLRFLDMRRIKDAPLSTPLFLAVLAAILFPWSLYLPQAAHFHWKKWREQKAVAEPTLFVFLWAAVVIGFFCASKFKLDYYSMPAWPALMLFIAHALASRAKARQGLFALSAPAILIFLGSAAGLCVFGKALAVYHVELPDPWFFGAAKQSLTFLLAGSLAAAAFIFTKRFKTALACLAVAMLPISGLAQQAFLRLGPEFSDKELAQAASRCLQTLPPASPLVHAEADEDIYAGGDAFYARRKVWLVMPREKQVFPLGRQFYLTPEQLASWWDERTPVLIVGDEERTAQLLRQKPSFRLAQIGGKVLVANQPVCGDVVASLRR